MKCEYYQWLATDRHFLFSDIEIDEDVRNVMIFIAILLAFIVMWVFSWCAVNDDPPWWLVCLAILGPVGTVTTVILGLGEAI